jgi:hypothetical protein
VEDEEGNEMVLAYLNKGQFFGEMGLFHESPLRSLVRTRNHASCGMTYPLPPDRGGKSGLVFDSRRNSRRDRSHQFKLLDLALSMSPAVWRTPSWIRVWRTGCHDASRGHADQGQPELTPREVARVKWRAAYLAPEDCARCAPPARQLLCSTLVRR